MKLGQETEKQAVLEYSKRGYTVIETNYRYYGLGKGQKAEIDIIAFKKNLLVCIEVKYRKAKSIVSAEESITHKKLQLMQTALLNFLSQHPRFASHQIRFDAVIVNGDKFEIIENIL